MKVELLHIVDCPNTDIAEANARAALDALGLGGVPVEVVTIRTEAEAASTQFGGSPTILVDGVDLFPTAPVRSLACRVYATESGFAGAPTPEQIEAALRGASR
ncbi:MULTISPECIES: hypothetical protein [Leucobacter]|jgi:hypothetical protein|uniref:Thioredoxin family protein n=2 Tax=Leucobacter TaxID=55968 RepID=A0A4Q7U474_9MICO|nr:MULTISPECIES: hypothetical protein [Leucobacter]MBL3691095.1 hypothetical protein [Leucobacter chromiireducens subsp. chromiireducens]MBL3700828.1 hypothetical protein [Leucobacter luti]RZT68333.1 hypothetical protein EV139_0056 [Leucobacter luti]